jgi:hypothetical protein
MHLPDYSITNKILNKVAEIERARGIIENTFVLPFSQNSLKKEAKEKKIYNLLLLEEFDVSLYDVKKHFDSISPHLNQEILKIIEIESNLDLIGKSKTSWNQKIKNLNQKIINTEKVYRIKKIPNKVLPEEILAKTTEIGNWLDSDDVKNTHPLIVAAIIFAELEIIKPFEKLSTLSNNLISEMFLHSNNFKIIEYVPYQEIINLKRYKYNDSLDYVIKSEDFTEWVDFYLDCINQQIQILKDKYMLLEKEARQKSIPQVERLTSRQQRIYQYLIDYKFIQNSQFSILFPDISEDSILRDLKTLIEQGLIVKTGKTKSSKYEIKH